MRPVLSTKMPGDAESAKQKGHGAGKKTVGALWRLMKEKALETGVQGVPNIGRARDRFRRVFWILVVFTGTVLMTWQVTVSFMKYYTYPVKTQMLYKNADQVDVPAVTICNLNPLRVSQLCDDGMMSGFKKKYSPKGNTKKPSRFNDWEEDDLDMYSKEAKEFSMIQSFLTLAAQLTPMKRRRIGHHLHTMLLSCTWNGLSCSPRNFSWFNNHRYGNCFTFNSDNVNKTLVLNKPGALYGLSLELYIEQDEYSPVLSDAAGVRVIVHNQTEMAFPEDAGFSVNPGHKTSVALSKVDVVRAPPPNGNCVEVDRKQNERVNAFLGDVPTIGYSAATCYQIHLMRNCGCYDARYPSGPNITAYENVTYISHMLPCKSASMRARGKALCEETTLRRYVQGKLGCTDACPVECFQTQYSYGTSQSEWPSTVKEHEVMEQLMDKSEYLWDVLANETDTWRKMFLRSNALKVDIYFKELDYQEIVTSPSYELEDLLADLGGHAGLWLGVSIIAIFEFIELVYDVISVAALRQMNAVQP